MKRQAYILFFFFTLNLLAQDHNDIIFSLKFNSKINESITLYIENNSNSEIEMFNTIHGSFRCLVDPSIELILETYQNNLWTKIDYKIEDTYRFSRCSPSISWREDQKPIIIKKSEKVKIGYLRFPGGLSNWFNFYGNKKLRLTAKYTVKELKNKLTKQRPFETELISKPIEIDYENIRNPFDYHDFYNQLLSSGQLTKRKFRQGAKGLTYPGDNKRRLGLALKKFGITIKDLQNKIVNYGLARKTTDKINPVPISCDVINNNGKGYLVLYIQYISYGLEKKYTKDFCKIYEIN